jgi:hypothetical protein
MKNLLKYFENIELILLHFNFFFRDSTTNLLQDVEQAGVKGSGSGPRLMDLGLWEGEGEEEGDPVGQGKEQESG